MIFKKREIQVVTYKAPWTLTGHHQHGVMESLWETSSISSTVQMHGRQRTERQERMTKNELKGCPAISTQRMPPQCPGKMYLLIL